MLDTQTVHNPTGLPDELLKEFFSSPLQATDRFKEQFIQASPSGSRSVNRMFILRCSNTEKIPDFLRDRTILADQRSDEWLKLLEYYQCGRNQGLIPYTGSDWVGFYYNLIRGAIIEAIMIDSVDYSDLIPDRYTKVLVGLLVQDRSKPSPGIAPDLLLVTDKDEVIPVEIKCLIGRPNDNRNFRRDRHLAQLQLKSSLDIIGRGRTGIMTFVYIYTDQNMKYSFEVRNAVIEI